MESTQKQINKRMQKKENNFEVKYGKGINITESLIR